jgi:hypothetical protein
MIRVCIIAGLVLTGCADVLPNKLLIGADHTSHVLQHFEHEGTGGTVGCSGPMLGLRWQEANWYVQASDSYCAIGTNDNQREVANLQGAIEVSLR